MTLTFSRAPGSFKSRGGDCPLEDNPQPSDVGSAAGSPAGDKPFVLELEQSLYCAFRPEYVVGISVPPD